MKYWGIYVFDFLYIELLRVTRITSEVLDENNKTRLRLIWLILNSTTIIIYFQNDFQKVFPERAYIIQNSVVIISSSDFVYIKFLLNSDKFVSWTKYVICFLQM